MTREQLRRAAEYFSARPEFLGYHLRRDREQHRESLAEQARNLGVSDETVDHLSLCLAPRTDTAADWQRDTQELQQRFGVHPRALVVRIGPPTAW